MTTKTINGGHIWTPKPKPIQDTATTLFIPAKTRTGQNIAFMVEIFGIMTITAIIAFTLIHLTAPQGLEPLLHHKTAQTSQHTP